MAIWDDILTEQDRAIAERSGYGRTGGFGERPVVIVIDVNVNFCGDRPEPVLESITRWRNSCGSEAWATAEQIATMLDAARARQIPIVYSTNQDPRPDGFDSGRWADKNWRRSEDRESSRVDGNTIIAPIAPRPEDILIRKTKPSVFFATSLIGYLVDLRADTLICCGATTSGCVRATVVDGFSYNFRMGVVEECTFDRTQSSHKINLFDLQQKYADIVSLESALAYLSARPIGLFDSQMPSLAEAAAGVGS